MDMVNRLFSPVVNSNATVPTFEYHPYKQDQLQVRSRRHSRKYYADDVTLSLSVMHYEKFYFCFHYRFALK